MKRLRPPGITPLEVWNAEIDGRTLFSWQNDPSEFPRALATVARRLAQGAHAFEHVHVTGGGALRPGVREALEAAGFIVVVAEDPVFSAVRAAPALVDAPSVLCADIGQTSIKVFVKDLLCRIERDFTRAPLIDTIAPAALAAARLSTVNFMAGALDVLAGEYWPPATVLAMPCAVDDALAAADCSYAWPSPDPTLLDDIIARTPLDHDQVFVLNDAELAAFAAARDERLPRGVPFLTLTLGFGVGAALGDTAIFR